MNISELTVSQEFEIKVPVKVMFVPHEKSGSMAMTYADVGFDITSTDAKTKETTKYGSVYGALGGAAIVNVVMPESKDFALFGVDFRNIWNEVVKALEREELVLTKKQK